MDRRYALVIAIDQYRYLGTLTKAASDAEELAQILELYGKFKVTRLPRVWDEPNETYRLLSSELSYKTLIEELKEFLDDATGGEALIYFSGHGYVEFDYVVERLKDGYLAASDSKFITGFIKNREVVISQEQGFSLRSLNELMAESKVMRLALFLDCCHAGSALEDDLVKSTLTTFTAKDGYFFLGACKKTKKAYEGVFTRALLEALSAEEANKRDGQIVCDDLVGVIRRKLANEEQEPIKLSAGTSMWLVQYSYSDIKPLFEIANYLGDVQRQMGKYEAYLQHFQEKSAAIKYYKMLHYSLQDLEAANKVILQICEYEHIGFDRLFDGFVEINFYGLITSLLADLDSESSPRSTTRLSGKIRETLKDVLTEVQADLEIIQSSNKPDNKLKLKEIPQKLKKNLLGTTPSNINEKIAEGFYELNLKVLIEAMKTIYLILLDNKRNLDLNQLNSFNNYIDDIVLLEEKLEFLAYEHYYFQKISDELNRINAEFSSSNLEIHKANPDLDNLEKLIESSMRKVLLETQKESILLRKLMEEVSKIKEEICTNKIERIKSGFNKILIHTNLLFKKNDVSFLASCEELEKVTAPINYLLRGGSR
jgi:hypothetical protein